MVRYLGRFPSFEGAVPFLAVEEPHMSDKSPRQTASKKSGKSLKEKRGEKKAKAASNAAAAVIPPTSKR